MPVDEATNHDRKRRLTITKVAFLRIFIWRICMIWFKAEYIHFLQCKTVNANFRETW